MWKFNELNSFPPGSSGGNFFPLLLVAWLASKMFSSIWISSIDIWNLFYRILLLNTLRIRWTVVLFCVDEFASVNEKYGWKHSSRAADPLNLSQRIFYYIFSRIYLFICHKWTKIAATTLQSVSKLRYSRVLYIIVAYCFKSFLYHTMFFILAYFIIILLFSPKITKNIWPGCRHIMIFLLLAMREPLN